MSISRGQELVRTRLPWVLGQAGLVISGIVVYFGVRGLTEGSADAAVSRGRDILALERSLGIDLEGALQAPVRASETLETAANWTYIWGHWPVIVITMLWLAWRHRGIFLRLRDAMMVSGAVGMLIFVSFPVAPPRLAGLGMLDTVTESSEAYRVLQPPAFVNQYAALPSLHAGWDLLVGISILSAASSLALRVVGFAMPMLMGLAVLMTANHYLIDVVAGVTLVLIGHLAALHLEHRRHRRAVGAR
ncbi:MAG TPA: phosphatase PAP2 family protein [Nocardioides sp.]|nr:phosphatase PAP2 family protein [Nocardioides sp.]